GPGRSTDLLRSRSASLTAVEPDPAAAAALAGRFAGTNVVVLEADASDLPFGDGTFTGAVAMTMLHHVPTVAAQDAVLAEACRVLRPGGWFVGVDSLDDPGFREFHAGDVCLPVDPDALEPRLRAAGFTEIQVERGDGTFRFAARRAKEMTRR
ncbi:MAG TPA: class I SAM-dependent methyltransferase, partial [Actinomycetota bacterium]|nr:class I SAM-dependent methyltransferase [Actinomycetota bacterium]